MFVGKKGPILELKTSILHIHLSTITHSALRNDVEENGNFQKSIFLTLLTRYNASKTILNVELINN